MALRAQDKQRKRFHDATSGAKKNKKKNKPQDAHKKEGARARQKKLRRERPKPEKSLTGKNGLRTEERKKNKEKDTRSRSLAGGIGKTERGLDDRRATSGWKKKRMGKKKKKSSPLDRPQTELKGETNPRRPPLPSRPLLSQLFGGPKYSRGPRVHLLHKRRSEKRKKTSIL